MIKRLVLWLLAAIAIVYGCDYISVRHRIPGNREQTGTVSIRREYAVKQKNKKTEFYFDPPRDETCSHSLFPQLGYFPCWYLERHKTELVEL